MEKYVETCSLPAPGGHKDRLLSLIERHEDTVFVTSKAAEFVDSIHQYYAWPGVKLPASLSWDEDPYKDPSWNWRLHVMKAVFFLARAYELTGLKKYLLRAEEMVLDWIDKHSGVENAPPSCYSWGDHSTALRLIHWLYFLEVWSSSNRCQADKLQLISRAIIDHGTRLADADFYRERDNHGIDQDSALLALALMHPGLPQSSNWTELCLERLRKQLRQAVSRDGVHLEHSPSYHVFGMVQMARLRNFLVSWQLDHPLLDELGQTLNLMAGYLEYIVRPDGRVVLIGDSWRESICTYKALLGPALEHLPELKSIVVNGKIAANKDIAKLYQEEAYLVIRDFDRGQLPFDRSLHLFFTAAAHEGYVHGQTDGLSFVLHASGRDILIDHGYYSYQQDEGRAYFSGVASHSTVMVDGISYDGCDSRIDNVVTGAGYTLLRASHRNYSGLEHIRWLLHLRPDLIMVIDRIDPLAGDMGNPPPNATHIFDQLWQLALDLDAQVSSASRNSTEVVISGADQKQVLKLTQFNAPGTSLELRVAKGEKEPLMGWTVAEHARLVPSPVLISSIGGPCARFISVLDLSCQRHGWQLDSGAEEPMLLRLRWRQGGSDCTLALDLSHDELRIDEPGHAG